MYTSQHTDRTHLSQDDRAVIEALHMQGATLRDIAQVIHHHYSTICRELERNSDGNGTYIARSAQKKSVARRRFAKCGARKIENNPVLGRIIEEKLHGKHPRGDWSPAVIARVLGTLCHQTIYTWIRRSRPDLRQFLPRYGRNRRQYGSKTVPASRGWMTYIRSIDTRPDDVRNRTTLGHFEGDTVVLERGVRALLTLVDRKSRFLIADLISGTVGMSYAVHETLVAHLAPLPPCLRQTITPDRGSEFSYWDMTEKEVPGLRFYFAHPRAPWERGTNEHTNGLLRRYFSKKDKHGNITTAQVAEVVWMINHRPRKSLDWETPCKVFGACCVSR
jgi:transposase, IS30 family